MSLLRHDEIYPCDEGATTQGHALAHRMDEFRAGYSLAGYAPAEPASASPAGVHHAIPSVRRPSEMQRIENSVLTACLTQGDNPKLTLSSPEVWPDRFELGVLLSRASVTIKG